MQIFRDSNQFDSIHLMNPFELFTRLIDFIPIAIVFKPVVNT